MFDNSGMTVFAGAKDNGSVGTDKRNKFFDFGKGGGHVGIKEEGIVGGGGQKTLFDGKTFAHVFWIGNNFFGKLDFGGFE